MLILSLEASTTSAKAMLYDTDTNETQVRTKTYPKMYEDKTLHNGETVFQCMVDLGKELAEGLPVDMIALVGAWHSIMLCDQKMIPVTPVYPWTNTEASGICESLRKDVEYTKSYYHRTGCMVHNTYPFFKLKLLKERGYVLSDYKIIGQGSYNTYRLTGEQVVTACMKAGSGLLNITKKDYDKQVLQELEVTKENFFTLIPYDKTYPLTLDGAKYLGLKEGIPVIPCNSDGGLNQVGVGALEEGIMTFSVGTSGAMRLSAPQPFIPEEPNNWCYLTPKTWLVGAATAGCCNCIDWFKEKIAGPDATYESLEREGDILDTPIFMPFLYGERCPGWDDERRGEWAFLSSHHDVCDMYRGVQQGVLFSLYHCYLTLTANREKPKRVKLSGGILKSKVWTQMCADIFNIDIEIDQEHHASLKGGIVLAMELLDLIKDIADYKTQPSDIIKPQKENIFAYQKKFEEYLYCYNRSEVTRQRVKI